MKGVLLRPLFVRVFNVEGLVLPEAVVHGAELLGVADHEALGVGVHAFGEGLKVAQFGA